MSDRVATLLDPYQAAFAVTPEDGSDLVEGTARGLYVGVAGDLAVTLANMTDGTSIVFTAAAQGYHRLSVKRVWATGTAATNVLALY